MLAVERVKQDGAITIRKARVGQGQGGVVIDCPRWTCGTVETVGPYGSGVIYGFDTTADGRP